METKSFTKPQFKLRFNRTHHWGGAGLKNNKKIQTKVTLCCVCTDWSSAQIRLEAVIAISLNNDVNLLQCVYSNTLSDSLYQKCIADYVDKEMWKRELKTRTLLHYWSYFTFSIYWACLKNTDYYFQLPPLTLWTVLYDTQLNWLIKSDR